MKNSVLDKSYKAIESNYTQEFRPPPDRTDTTTRILLALLGLAILFFTTISPLAVLVALGRG